MRIRTVAVVLLVAVVGIGLSCYGAWRLLLPSALRPPPPQPVCVAHADGEASFTPEQTANAATIAAIGMRRGLPVRAVQVALATAMQESKLRNLAGGDRDSVGLFQQRPSQGWGAPEQLMDVRFAAGAFYAALVKVRGWQAMEIGDAAQAVQRSAYPDAYAQWVEPAGVLARAFAGEPDGAVACTLPGGPTPRDVAAVGGLTAGLGADWGPVTTAATAGGLEVTVRAVDQPAGWRYAYWLVAHAEEHGVEQVRAGGLVWTATDGRWTAEPAATANAGAAGAVVARVRGGR
ncbi:hypothetical protein ACNTMW_04560 [Planosporangium sp. 12N6]|uniref:hypothetical protein n=1 Tax=Planosporangium spinosum TaxID=3402278 RepID=UPI003CE958A1